jgi:DNA-binding beta-propeller fold protein YncE
MLAPHRQTAGGGSHICIYPPGKKSPSSKLSVKDAGSIAFNEKENLIYVAQYKYGFVRVLDYPSGSLVAIIPVRNFPIGVALIPAFDP